VIDLLDTNILLYLIKNRPPHGARCIDALSDEDSLVMSFITWAELLQGAHGRFRRINGRSQKSSNPGERMRYASTDH